MVRCRAPGCVRQSEPEGPVNLFRLDGTGDSIQEDSRDGGAGTTSVSSWGISRAPPGDGYECG